MQQAIVDQKLKSRPPDIYIRPDLSEFRTLHYHRAEEIYEQAESAKIELKRQLSEKFEAWNVQRG